LSVTQRRILTLLDNPVRLGDLQVGRSLDTGRLVHEAVRLQHAGHIVCESIRDTSGIAAANAATMQAPRRPFARSLPIAVVLIAASIVVWAGWHHASVTPASDSRRHARAAQTPSVPMTQVPDASTEPPVIATRVLKGEVVDRTRETAKDRTAPRAPTPSVPERPSTASDLRPDDTGVTPDP
jgi:hypothetical protein